MFCSNCGSQLRDGAKFCPMCGAPQNMPPEVEPPEGVVTPPEGVVTPPVNAGTGSSPSSGGDGKQAGKTALVAVVSVLCTAVVLCVVWMLLGGRGDTDGAAVTGGGSQGGGESSSLTQNVEKESLDLQVSQVDNSAFPTVTLYARIANAAGEAVGNVSTDEFVVTELGQDGSEHKASIKEIAKIAAGDAMSINLVLDQSASMSSSGKMENAQWAASSFIEEMSKNEGTIAEITSFDDYVYNRQPFTSDTTLLNSAVNSLSPTGDTALNDALYWAIQRTNLKSGSRVVIAFTDGEENSSSYSQGDVIELSRLTGIPVYIIGIGDGVRRSDLSSLASSCNGSYFDVSTTNLGTALAEIYEDIYSEQRSLYRVVFESSFTSEESSYRTVRLSCAEGVTYTGSCETTYMPVDNVPAYESSANFADYVLPYSDSTYYTRAELERLSLWELYLARNEIFARHGRGFKNQDLVEYFATRRWYTERYTPEEFDAMPTPLNDYEQKNAELMLEIEKERNSPYLHTAE